MTNVRALSLCLLVGAAACSDTDTIECPTGYAGADCTACGVGYQDNNADGTCLPTCDTAATQGFACQRGTCSDASGWPTCACEPGYGGEGCTACDTGYQDNDNNMTCVATCATAEALGFGCVNGTCSDAAGTPTCACDVNYGGPLCDSCGPNSVRNEAGACVGTFGTCAEVKTALPSAANGFYKLHVAKNPLRPWVAYCHDMATTPTEYLQVSANNFSQYTAGGAAPGTNVRTTYARIRIDPVTLVVNISDQTFSTSSGSLTHSNMAVTSMPLGVAMSCDGNASGVASIDLTGTPFKLTETFCRSSNLGVITFSNNDQTVALTGGGFCGWTSPQDGTSCLFNPFNTTGGAVLSLAYLVP